MDDWEAMLDQDVEDIQIIKKDDNGEIEVVETKKETVKEEPEIEIKKP